MLQLRRCPRCESNLEENGDAHSTHICLQCGYLYVGNGFFDEIQKPTVGAINAENEIAKRIKSVIGLLQVEKFLVRAQKIQLLKETALRVSVASLEKTPVYAGISPGEASGKFPSLLPSIPTRIGVEMPVASVMRTHSRFQRL